MPIDCEMMENWLEKIKTDDTSKASDIWVARNTKKCPSCKSPVNKNGGCNHMTCGICRHEFCWLCLLDVNAHGGSWRPCNSLQAALAKGAKEEDLVQEELKENEEFESMRL